MESADLGVTAFDCADIHTGVEELYGRFERDRDGLHERTMKYDLDCR